MRARFHLLCEGEDPHRKTFCDIHVTKASTPRYNYKTKAGNVLQVVGRVPVNLRYAARMCKNCMKLGGFV